MDFFVGRSVYVILAAKALVLASRSKSPVNFTDICDIRSHGFVLGSVRYETKGVEIKSSGME